MNDTTEPLAFSERKKEQKSFCFVAGQYSLSVKFQDPAKGPIVKHYRIRNLDDGGYYISTRITFKSLDQLVKHYLSEYIYLMYYLCLYLVRYLCLCLLRYCVCI